MQKEYMPLFIQIKSDIINRISSGELKKGDRLPSERELAETFGVSRITIRGTLRELEEEGIIVKRQGSGSYINTDTLKEDYDDIFSHITAKPEVDISFGLFNPTPQYEQLMKTLAGLFQLETPGTKINIRNIPLTSASDSDPYLIKIGSGDVPTVGEFYFHADYAAINGLMPLENMQGFHELTDSLRPQCVYKTADASRTEHIHALTYKTNTRVVMVNARLLREAGINPDIDCLDWSTLLDWTARIGCFTAKHKPGYYGIFPEIPSGWHNIVGNMPYLWGNTDKLNNSIDGFIKMLRQPQCAVGMDYLAELIAKGNPCYEPNGADLFAVGRGGIWQCASSWGLTLRRLMSDRFEIKAFQMPGQNKNHSVKSVLGNFSLGIFRAAIKSEEELDAAWKWIKFLFRSKQQFAITADYTFPARKNIPCLISQYEPAIGEVFAQAEASSIPQFDFKNMRPVYKIFGTELKRRLQGQGTAGECIENSIERITDSALN